MSRSGREPHRVHSSLLKDDDEVLLGVIRKAPFSLSDYSSWLPMAPAALEDNDIEYDT